MVRLQCINGSYCSRVRVVYHSMASPPDMKRVMPVGSVGSLPSSSLMLNQTCFLGFSSARAGALPCHTLLLDSWVLACSFMSHISRHSHSPGGPDVGGLGNDDEDCLWCSVKGLWHHLDLLVLLCEEHHFHDSDHCVEESSLGIWQTPLLMVPQRVSKFTKLSGPGSIFYSLRVSSKLVHPVGQP